MKRSPLRWIIPVVILLHILVLVIVYNKKVLPERRYVEPPNFKGGEIELIDEATGEQLTYKEFEVTTELNDSSENNSTLSTEP